MHKCCFTCLLYRHWSFCPSTWGCTTSTTDSGSTPRSSSHLEEVDIVALLPFIITHCLRNIQFISCQSVVFCISNSDLQLYDPRDIPDLIISVLECFPSNLEWIIYMWSWSSNHAMRVSTTFSNVELMVSRAWHSKYQASSIHHQIPVHSLHADGGPPALPGLFCGGLPSAESSSASSSVWWVALLAAGE